VVCVVGKLLHSSSTWWVIVAQYKDFKKSQESRPLLTTSLQTATFSHWDILPSLYILCLNKYSKTTNSLIGFGSNWVVIYYSVWSEISNIHTALHQRQYETEMCNITPLASRWIKFHRKLFQLAGDSRWSCVFSFHNIINYNLTFFMICYINNSLFGHPKTFPELSWLLLSIKAHRQTDGETQTDKHL